LEADFQRYYNIDLNRAVYMEEMTHRRFIVLVKGLPYESAWGRFLRDKSNREFLTPFLP
jgi:hypothetical protein